MANNQSTFTLKLKTEGMEQAQAGSKQIRENLEGAQRAAAATRVASSAAARPTGAAGVSAGIAGREVEEYNRAAGAAGKSGGSARDFADQARGLGGLVRLYATVAANAFAAAAAFGALSRAMDTANMVKGLDQLGAASGVALGSLSKRLVSTTDGAVSLREAMEATVKASSAGLDTNQILQLGDVSKKASQALGVNMTDALSRLTRGITKLEPELLDELGIFVKIDDATSKYALSVGKSTSALTDFERRQAFANAVLEQGKKKFDEIKIDSNPYAKLAASFQNLTQTILDFVNKGLGPVAKFLSENTTILAAVFAFVALKLTQAALPALGQWQEGLVKAAQTAKASAREINTSFGEAFVQRWTDKLRIPELEKQVEQGKKSLQSLAGMVDLQGMGRGKAALSRVLAGGTEAKDIKTLNNLLGEQTKKYEEALEANNKRQNATTRALQSEISFYQTAIDKSKALAVSTRELAEANKQFNKSAVEAPSGLGERAREMTARAADRKAQMYSALAGVSTNVLEEGIGSALKKLNTQLNVEGVGYIRRFTGLAIGAFSAVTTGIGIFANAVQGYLAIFTFLITIGAGILNFFSNTKKESEATSEAFGRLEGGLKTTRDTLERISMIKDPLEKLSVETIQAKANALKELGDSAVLAQKRAFDEITKMNFGDKVINLFKSFVGSDVQTKLAENITDSITQSLKLAEEGPAKEQAKKTLEAILGADINKNNLGKKIATLVQTNDREKIAKVTEAIQQLGFQSSVSAAKGTEFKESIKKLTTDIQEFNKSLTPGDAISKFAQDGIQSAQKLKLALDDPTQALQAMITASSDVNLLAIFPPQVATTLMEYNSTLNRLATSLQNVSEYAPKVKQEITALEKELEYLTSEAARRDRNIPQGEGRQTEATRQARAALNEQIEETKKQIADLKLPTIKLKAQIETDVDNVRAVFDNAIRSSLIKSSEMMGARIAAEVNKAQTVVLSTLAGMLGDTEVGIKLRTEIELKGIDASNAVARESANLAMEVDKLRIQMERRNLIDEKRELGTGDKSEDISNRRKQIDARLEQLKQAESIYLTKNVGGPTSKSLRKDLESGKDVSTDLLQAVQKFEGLNASGAAAAAQKQAVIIKSQVDLLMARQKLELESISNNLANLAASRQNLELQRQTGALTEAEFNAELYSLELKQRSAEVSKQRTEAQNEYNVLMDVGNRLVLKGKAAEAEQVYQLAEGKKLVKDRLITEQSRIDLANLGLQFIERELKTKLELIDREASLKQLEQETINIKEDTAIRLRDIQLQTAEQTNAYTEKYLSSLKYEAEVAKIVEEAKRKETTLTTQYKVEQERLFQQIAAELQKSGGEGTEKSADLAQKMTLSAEKYRADVQGIKSVTAAQLAQVSAIRAAKTEQDSFNSSLEAIKTFESVFTSMGSAVSNLVSSLGDAVKAQDQYNASREALNKKISSETDEKKKVELTEQLADLDKQRAKDELTANAKLMGSAKSLFKEKTVAYKAFAALEKALHIARIAMDLKELAMSLFVEKGKVAGAVAGETAQTAATGAGFFARAGLYVTEIFSKISAQLGIFGPPVAAALIAAIGLSVFGGGSKTAPAGFTAEEQNKVQVTGQEYRNGKLVTVEGGVPGDPTARPSSVAKSLELVSKNTFNNLEYSNKMLDALKSIERNTRGLTAAMLTGLNPTAEGTLPSSIPQGQIRGNYVGSGTATAIGGAGGIGLGMGVSSLLAGVGGVPLIGGALGAMGAGLATALGGMLLPGIGLLLAKPLGKLIGKIVGGKTTQTIESFGISVNGVLDDVIKGTKGVVQEWANVKTVIDRGIFRSDKVEYSTQTQEAQQSLKDLVGSLFLGVKDTIIEAGKSLGKDVSSSIEKYIIEGFSITSKDLSPEDLAQAIQGKISIAFNKMAEVNFPELKNYSQPFEEAGETLVRIARQAQVFDLAMKATGKSVENLTYFSKLRISDTLINLAGGIEQFVDKTTYFIDNFLTEAQRLEPIQKSVTEELNKLGLGFVDTREEFAALVLGIKDFTVPGAIELYNSLIDLAPAFAAVYKETEKLLSPEDLRSKTVSQQETIFSLIAKLTGKESDALVSLTFNRTKELAELSKYPKVQADILMANQNYIFALEDEQKAKDMLIKQQEKLTSTINTLKTALDTINNYRQTLMGGQLSILTPEQQYSQARTQFLDLTSLISGPAVTEAEKLAQREAISKLPAVADKFLQTSRTIYASSDKYTTDFESVLTATDTSQNILENTLTDAQKQLAEIQVHTGILTSISDSSKTTAELIEDFLRTGAASSIARFAAGNIITPESIAHEVSDVSGAIPKPAVYGPSIEATIEALPADLKNPFYDFWNRLFEPSSTPTVIPTNTPETNPIVTELINVRQEISTLTTEIGNLRTEQQAQTGSIITSNAQVTNLTATSISSSLDDMFRYRDWNNRVTD